MADEYDDEEIEEPDVGELDRLMKKLDRLASEEDLEEIVDEDAYVPKEDTKPIWEHVATSGLESIGATEEFPPTEEMMPSPPKVRKVVKKVRKPVKEVKKAPVKAARKAVPGKAGGMAFVKERTDRVMKEVGRVVLGKEYVLKMVMTSILADGHVLFEDYPGLAKTLMANTFARVLGCTFKRVQFTPDLLPADITGTYIFDEKERDFRFLSGPIFTNILLADEINRSPPKTQAALLEAMQERQVTIEGNTMPLERPFIVIATQNPIEYEGTYSLPEAQLDRFLIRLSVGYPDEKVERLILKKRMKRKKDEVDVETITDPPTILRMQRLVEDVYVSDPIIEYIVAIVRATREDPRVMVGSSPRGSLAIFKLSRALAAIEGRDYVIPDDVKAVAVHALNHRIILNPEPRIMGVKPADVVRDILAETPVPVVE